MAVSTWLQLAGLGLGAFGNYKNVRAEEKAMEQAKALEDDYKDRLQAWQDAQTGSGNARAMEAWRRQMDYWQRQRDAELAVLEDKGATDAELAQHESQLAQDFMKNMEAFNPDQLAQGIQDNTDYRQDLQDQALGNYREARDAETDFSTGGMSQQYQDAMAQGMADADESGTEYAGNVASLNAYGDERQGEQSALRDISLNQGYAGERAKALIEKLAALRQDGKGYVVAPAPMMPDTGGGGGSEGRPEEPDQTIEVDNKWGWLSTLGSLAGSVGSILGAPKTSDGKWF